MRDLSINRKKNSSFYIILTLLIFICLLFFSSCKRQFVRPHGIYDLGEVRFLLKPMYHVEDKRIMVFFDDAGWSAMSTRCPLDGCDLSIQEKYLYNPCSKIYYDHQGKLLSGNSPRSLPRYAIRYSDGRLFADVSKEVPQTYRFMTEELSLLIPELKRQNQKEGVGDMPDVPEVLQGQGDGEPGYIAGPGTF